MTYMTSEEARLLQETMMPEVGMGATVGIGTDCYPYTVVEVLRGGKAVVIQRDRYEAANETRNYGDHQDWLYHKDEDGPKETYTRRKDNRFHPQGATLNSGYRLTLGSRRYYRDPHF